ncbi:MAG: CHASE3 domain-containing protein [Microbacteriaceae bacterium]|nr:CHASE3 domain-containing protein [Burkholderiaceae bacterium]
MDVAALARRNPIVFPLACAAAVTMVVISEGSHWQSVRTLDQLGTMATASGVVQGLQQSILVAETGQRGYLLSGRPEHLLPYRQALHDIDAGYLFLDRYYSGQPDSAAVLDQLRQLTRAKLSELALSISRRDKSPGVDDVDNVLTDPDRQKMNAILMLASELMDHESERVETGRQNLQRTLMISRIGVTALSAISLLALALYLKQTAALKAQQLALKKTVQAERDRLDIEIKRRTAQLTELTHHLQTAREDERHRLARNLHDELGALLTSAKLDAARIKSRLAGTAPEALERLAHLVDTLNQSIALGRSIIEDLRPSTLSNLGLVVTLEILAREFAERSNVEVACDLAPVVLGERAELMVYRLAQEAITNISKYAKARHVWLTLGSQNGLVTVTVRDDGVGFDTSVEPRSAYGLVGMRYRVEAEGGSLRVVSAPGMGTQLQVSLPASGATPA